MLDEGEEKPNFLNYAFIKLNKEGLGEIFVNPNTGLDYTSFDYKYENEIIKLNKVKQKNNRDENLKKVYSIQSTRNKILWSVKKKMF